MNRGRFCSILVTSNMTFNFGSVADASGAGDPPRRGRSRGGDEAKPGRRALLVGQPNVGKSVVFGALTGTYVTVSNYPGTTVEVTRGRARFGDAASGRSSTRPARTTSCR